jgi:NCS2 family nucleobase:cation symporter-2
VPTRPPELLYSVGERPPWGTLVALGCQHAALVSIYLILIVIVGRAAHAPEATIVATLSLAMLALAAGAALQASPLGSGFLAVPVFSAIYLGPSIIAAKMGGLPLVFGMTIFAGIIEIALSRALPKLRELFPPSVSGFIVLLVGINLGLVGMRHTLDVGSSESGGADFAAHVFAAVLTATIAIGLVVWGKGPLRLVGSLIGLVVGFVTALLLGLVPEGALSIVAAVPVLSLPNFAHGGFSFEAAMAPAFFAAAVAATLRTIGVVASCQKLNDADWKRPDLANVERGVFADGLGTAAAGVLGAIGVSVAPSLVGVSRAARATSRWIAYACAAILVVAAFVPKVAALFLALPLAVAGGMLVFTSSLIITSGINIMMSRGLDSRATFVIGISLLLALGRIVFPEYFEQLPTLLRTFTGDPLAVGVVSSVLLTLLFRIGVRQNAILRLKGDADSIEDFLKLIPERGKGWNVPADTIERCRASVETFLGKLRDAGLASEVVECRLIYDDIDLVAGFVYEGAHAALSGIAGKSHPAADDDPIAHGVSAFLSGVYPDRVETSHEGDRSRVRLIFNA